jgi:hypothetical protein
MIELAALAVIAIMAFAAIVVAGAILHVVLWLVLLPFKLVLRLLLLPWYLVRAIIL